MQKPFRIHSLIPAIHVLILFAFHFCICCVFCFQWVAWVLSDCLRLCAVSLCVCVRQIEVAPHFNCPTATPTRTLETCANFLVSHLSRRVLREGRGEVAATKPVTPTESRQHGRGQRCQIALLSRNVLCSSPFASQSPAN